MVASAKELLQQAKTLGQATADLAAATPVPPNTPQGAGAPQAPVAGTPPVAR